MRRIRPEDLPAQPLAREVLRRFMQEAHPLAPGRVGRIIVYGSMARGDGGDESDLDLWVDWQGKEAEGRRILGDLAARLFVETGLLVSVHVVSEPHRRLLEEWGTAFYQNVESEGLVVDA